MRWVVFGGLAVGVALVAWAHSRPLRAQYAYLSLQRQCMNFVAPPTRVVYEEDPQQARALFLKGTYGGIARPLGDSAATTVIFHHGGLTRLGVASSGVVFLHARKSAAGNERLVCVSTHTGFSAPGPSRWVPLTYQVGTPATRTVGSRMTFNSFIPLHVRLSEFDEFRLFAGQPDPADPSHFTIGYELNDVPGTIDGWLQDDDRIKFQYRDGPATTRPTAYQF